MSYEKICLNCHLAFKVAPIRKDTAKFCCMDCCISFKGIIGDKRVRQTFQKKMWELRREHPCKECGKLCGRTAQWCKKCSCRHKSNYKGGRINFSTGYIGIWQPQHPRAWQVGYVMEHILVWEQANGKPLPEGWVIHHLNGIKTDNRLSNLIALPNRKHYLVLQAKAKRIQELEGLLNNQYQLT